MEITAQNLADLLGGEIAGDPATVVTGPARIEQAREGDVCFFANPKYEHYIYDTRASVLLVNRTFEPRKPVPATLIKVDDAYRAVSVMLDFFASLRPERRRGNRLWARLSLRRSVAASARIGKGTYIYPQVYVGPRVKVGRNCILYPGVRIYHDCVIGDGCILHAGVVVGADGFGFAPLDDGSYRKIRQLGNVVIEDDVEIGANATVDRATMGSTIIRKGVKIDNLCQVAHNVEVGQNTVMAALSGIAGSARVGAQCQIGGQSGVAGHVKVADGTVLAGQSGIIGDVRKSGATLMGYPALDRRTYLRAYAKFRKSATSDQ
ncbi:MAG: UDP-3-O-(3-hydroxymyristoyl)glucosamine N-acyltransferase [Bacteroidales bacterium]|nr:UDP-3-O-(3-hydroxymyristoyl)glucosamine N-acyltransferase [Bacteroidales bacterium]